MNIIWEAIPLVTLATTSVLAIERWAAWRSLAEKWRALAADLDEQSDRLLIRAYRAEFRLAAISAKRHLSAKRARAAQLQQDRAKVKAVADKIRVECGL